MDSKWKLILQSRKFWAAVVGAFVVVLNALAPDLVIPEESVLNLVLIVVGYIFGVALEDGLTAVTRKKE